MKIFNKTSTNTFLLCFLMLAVLISTNANADMVTFESTKLVNKAGQFNDDIYLDESGTYKVTLTDFKLAGSFSEVGLVVQNNLGIKKGDIFGQGSFSFNAEAGLYHLELGILGTDAMGLIGITMERFDLDSVISPTPVPLPMPLLLLFSALITLLSLSKYKILKQRKLVC